MLFYLQFHIVKFITSLLICFAKTFFIYCTKTMWKNRNLTPVCSDEEED